jgi:DNA polymerase-4
VSYNKFLAKLTPDYRKPDGFFVITPRIGPAFVESLPVGQFHGIGPATTAKMNRLAIYTGLDLRSQPIPFLQEQFSKAGSYYYWIARGVDHRPVQPDRVRKSVGAENTFSNDLIAFEEMKQNLVPIIDKVWRYCEGTGVRGRTVTLKVKYADFQHVTRSRSFVTSADSKTALEHASVELLNPCCLSRRVCACLGSPCRRLGRMSITRAHNWPWRSEVWRSSSLTRQDSRLPPLLLWPLPQFLPVIHSPGPDPSR